jgi:hypothetical protein
MQKLKNIAPYIAFFVIPLLTVVLGYKAEYPWIGIFFAGFQWLGFVVLFAIQCGREIGTQMAMNSGKVIYGGGTP